MTLVDTSAWIESLRPSGNAGVRERVRSLLLHGDAACARHHKAAIEHRDAHFDLLEKVR